MALPLHLILRGLMAGRARLAASVLVRLGLAMRGTARAQEAQAAMMRAFVKGALETVGSIRVKVEGLDRTTRYLSDVEKQIKYATAVALTRTAKDVEARLRKEMAVAFDRPTPWVMRGTFVRPATKQDLRAIVGIQDRQALYVREHFAKQRSARGQKPFEKALATARALPAGWVAMPAAGLKLDSRGNPSRAQLIEIIGALKSGMAVAKGRGKRMALVGHFAVMPGDRSHLAPGVYVRRAREIKPVLIFVREATYRPRIDLARIAQDEVNRSFNRHFEAAFSQAMRSIR